MDKLERQRYQQLGANISMADLANLSARNQAALEGSQAQALYRPPFHVTIAKPTNGFIVHRENGETLVFTDPKRLLGYLREAIGLPMDEVSAEDSGVLMDDATEAEDSKPEKGVHDIPYMMIDTRLNHMSNSELLKYYRDQFAAGFKEEAAYAYAELLRRMK